MRHLIAIVFILIAGCEAASAVSLMNGSVLTVNGLSMTVSGCQLALASSWQSSCAAANLQLIAAGDSTDAGYEITGANGGSIFNVLDGSGVYEVYFNLSVAKSVSTANTTVSSVSVTSAGTLLSQCGEGLIEVQNYVSTLGTATLLPGQTASGTFGPVGSLSVSNTLYLDANGSPGYGYLALNSVTETFNPAPEPASVAIMITGLGGLYAARRRRRAHGPS